MKPKCETDKHGDKLWYLNGKLHREDGSAVEKINGDKEWWINGKLHREDGPAIIWNNGDEIWFIGGKIHREDGPAVKYNGYIEWWINDEQLTEEEFINYKRYCKICNNQLRHMKAINKHIFYCEGCKR